MATPHFVLVTEQSARRILVAMLAIGLLLIAGYVKFGAKARVAPASPATSA